MARSFSTTARSTTATPCMKNRPSFRSSCPHQQDSIHGGCRNKYASSMQRQPFSSWRVSKIKMPRFQGRSLVPLLEGLSLDPIDAFSEATNVGTQSALRSADSHKLIYSLINPQWLLFDLGSDPGELHDLSAQRAERLRELMTRLEAWREENRAFRSQINVARTGVDRVVTRRGDAEGAGGTWLYSAMRSRTDRALVPPTVRMTSFL